MTAVRAVSYGGGVQSTALLVLAARGDIDYPLFLHADVGHDSEAKGTIRYVREVAEPYAAAHDIELVRVRKMSRHGDAVTLRAALMREDSRSVPIPMRMSGNGAPGNRTCTADWKIKPVVKELKRRGATVDTPAVVAVGISTDEFERARPGADPRTPEQHRVYPLLDLGLNRADCMRLIADEGIPVPPRSACYFCPFHGREAWRELKRDLPDDFRDAERIEATVNERRAMLGKDPMWMHRGLRPLGECVDDQMQLTGWEDDCDSGACFT